MLLRSTFGFLAFTGLLATSSASLVSYRVTGVFDHATDDYAPLLGTEFTYDFSYDTDAPNLGDDSTASYMLADSRLHTALGDLGPDDRGGIDIDLAPEGGLLGVGAVSEDSDANIQVYGLFFPDLPAQTGALPTDFAEFASRHEGTFLLTSAGTVGTLARAGMASAGRFSVQAIPQSVPEPGAIGALAVGTATLLRRRSLRRGR